MKADRPSNNEKVTQAWESYVAYLEKEDGHKVKNGKSRMHGILSLNRFGAFDHAVVAAEIVKDWCSVELKAKKN